MASLLDTRKDGVIYILGVETMPTILIGYYNKANLITLLGLLFSLSSCFFVLNGALSGAVIFLIGAGICDLFDGVIKENFARLGDGVAIHSENTSNRGVFNMHGGIISGNLGHGVYFSGASIGIFRKQPLSGSNESGIVYGNETGDETDSDGVLLRNSSAAVSSPGTERWRRVTAYQNDRIDTSTGRGLSTNGNPPFGQ